MAESETSGDQDDPAIVNEGKDGEDVFEIADHPISPLEPEAVREDEAMSLFPLEQSPEPVEEVRPSSPSREQTIISLTESIFQTPLVTVSTPDSRARFYERFVVNASQSSPEFHLNCSNHPFSNEAPNIPQGQKRPED